MCHIHWAGLTVLYILLVVIQEVILSGLRLRFIYLMIIKELSALLTDLWTALCHTQKHTEFFSTYASKFCCTDTQKKSKQVSALPLALLSVIISSSECSIKDTAGQQFHIWFGLLWLCSPHAHSGGVCVRVCVCVYSGTVWGPSPPSIDPVCMMMSFSPVWSQTDGPSEDPRCGLLYRCHTQEIKQVTGSTQLL